MTFRGWLTVGMGCLCVVATPSHDQFCRDWERRGAYCDTPWDPPHGPHSDTGRIIFVSTGSVAVSTSSTNTVGETNPHFVAKFAPARLIVWPFLRLHADFEPLVSG